MLSLWSFQWKNAANLVSNLPSILCEFSNKKNFFSFLLNKTKIPNIIRDSDSEEVDFKTRLLLLSDSIKTVGKRK
jgi:hypothetical protein